MPDFSSDTLLKIKMIEKGIIPFSLAGSDVKSGLASLPEDERIKVKRKFRKLWRKAIRRHKHRPVYYKNLCRSCGLGLASQDLLPYHYRSRAKLVLDELSLEI